MRLISQLINGISRVLQKLLRFFNGTAISTFFDSTSGVFPVILILDMNDSKFAILSFNSSLQYRYKLPDVFK